MVKIERDVLQRKALSYSMSGDTVAGIEVANQMKLLAPTDYLGYRIAFNILLQEERPHPYVGAAHRSRRRRKGNTDGKSP